MARFLHSVTQPLGELPIQVFAFVDHRGLVEVRNVEKLRVTVLWNTLQPSSSARRARMYLGVASVVKSGSEGPRPTDIYAKRR